MKGLWIALAAIILIVFARVAVSRFKRTPVKETSLACIQQLQGMYHGISIYAEDHDGLLPGAYNWQDAIAEYVKSRNDLHCPSVKEGGYAFHRDLGGAKLASLPDAVTTPVVFDSSNLAPNVADNM